MRQILSIATLLLFCLAANSQTKEIMKSDKYTELWSKVLQLENKSLPKSAAEAVNNILKQAIKDQDKAQTIKAIIHLCKYENAIDEQNDTLIFNNLQNMIKDSKDKVEQAIIHSMLGELYLICGNNNIDHHNVLPEDYVPQDMKEWDQSLYYTKSAEHTALSIVDQALLEKTPTTSYDAVIERGEGSRQLYPSMYDFLALRALSIYARMDTKEELNTLLKRKSISATQLFSPADQYVLLQFNPNAKEYSIQLLETYRELLISLLNRNLKHSVILTELDKVNYLMPFFKKEALNALENMAETWRDDEFSVEIIDQIAATSADQDIPKIYAILQKAISKFPKYERIAILQNRLNQLIQPNLIITGKTTFSLSSKKEISIQYKNLKSLKLKLYKYANNELPNIQYNKLLRGKKQFISEFVIPLKSGEPYLSQKTTFTIPIAEYGLYCLKSETGESYTFAISDLAAFTRIYDDSFCEFFVLDRESGKPQQDTKINICLKKDDLQNFTITPVKTITSDKIGRAEYRYNTESDQTDGYYNRQLIYQAVNGSDNCSFYDNINYYNHRYYNYQNTEFETTNIYTDRSLYRPGQTVYFKAITYVKGNSRQMPHPVIGKKVSVKLFDSNWQLIESKEVVSNEFGSVAGEFILPQGAVLSGNFTIEVNGSKQYIMVEEYKAPKFEILFDKIAKTYKLGEEVTLKGSVSNFSGIKLINQQVKYRVIRNRSWWFDSGSNPTQIDQGVVETDNNGIFELKFTPEKEERDTFKSIYTFRIEVTVTDSNGETQSSDYTINAGDISMLLAISIPPQLEKSSEEKISITAKNLDGNIIKATGSYTLFAMNKDSIQNKILDGDFTTGEQVDLMKKLKTIPSGKYQLKLSTKDSYNNDIETSKEFVLFSYSDKKPPIETNEWIVIKNSDFNETKPAEVILGVSDKDLHILYEIWDGNRFIKREWIKMSEENKLFTIPYSKEYENDITLLFTYVKNEKFYTHNINISYKKEKKELLTKLETFRDKVRPGSREEWKISIKDQNGKPLSAEILASAYDLSLDKIYPTEKWQLQPTYINTYTQRPNIQANNSFDDKTVSRYFRIDNLPVKPLEFDKFNWFGFIEFSPIILTRAYGVKGYELMSEEKSDMLQKSAVSELSVKESSQPISDNTVETSATQIRTYFNETAFFYPQLRTNPQGEAQIVFTVPDVNTKWKFRILAHDKNLNSSTTEAIIISNKELMITPNAPRFLRERDTTSISTKISNLSDTLITGNVEIEFFNPATDEIINTISITNQKQPFSINKECSTEASWNFVVPDGLDMIGYRIIAGNGRFSDGEQHLLGILSDRTLVTESMQMNLNGSGKKEYSMKQLIEPVSKTAENYRLTLEFASNPAWYAIQALPVLSNPDNDNAISWFASYYANTLGYHISKSYPKISAIVDAWKKQGGEKETFISNLQKNQELKMILAEETPWVLEAKNEADQRAKLSLLFDLNHSQIKTSEALSKLKDLQTQQGGWSWYKGFYPNRSITLYILYGLNQLIDLKAIEITPDVEEMISKAIKFIDSETIREFEEFKRYNKNWEKTNNLATYQLEYLYVRSSYNKYPVNSSLQKIINFYTSIAERKWTSFDLYKRSLIAILMHKKGKTDIMNAILQSYREHATYNDEMGMFWANNSSSVFMSQSAVSTHTFIIEAFKSSGASVSEMDKMKQWLLKQKQTQLWESTHATIDAIYILLSSGTDWFAKEGETTITVGNNNISTENQEVGTGYLKKTWQRGEINRQMGNIVIDRKSSSPAWGALYLQYFEDIDKIEKASGPLNIDKVLFVEKTDSTGSAKLYKVTESSSLQVGDKLTVRLTIRSDRDFEFVHIKDLRASCLEPTEQISQTKWQNSIIYYQTTKDASVNYYIDHLPRGTYILEYNLVISRTGNYSNGMATIQCMYAPEFISHTKGSRIRIGQASPLSK